MGGRQLGRQHGDCENEAQCGKVERVRERLPELASTVVIDAAGPGSLSGLASHTEQDELDSRRRAIKPGDELP